MPETMKPTTKQRREAASGVSQNVAKRDNAAVLFANDELNPTPGKRLTDQAVADQVGVSRQSVTRWKRDSEFRAMIQDARGRIIADSLRLPIAQKHQRIRVLNDLHTKYLDIIQSRAERHAKEIVDTPENAMRGVFGDVTPPEAMTGMMVRHPKIAANGMTVVAWAFDKPLDSAIKETHKQAAQELGQWEETINVNTNQYQNEALDDLSVDALREIRNIMTREGRG